MMPQTVVSILVLLAASLCACAEPPHPYFSTGGEEGVDLKFWTKAEPMEVKVNSLEVSEDKAHTGKRSIKLDVTLTGYHYVYFAVSLNQRIESGQSYYASGSMYVEQFPSGGRNAIGLGTNRVIWYGPDHKQNTSGSYLFDSVDGPTDGWVTMESIDLGREAPAAAASTGLPTGTIDIDNIFLAIHGEFKGDRVVVYLDDLALSPIAEKPLREVNVGKFRILDKIFPFGIYGSTGGFRDADPSGVFNDMFPAPLWRTIPDFKRHHINAVIGGAREIYSDSPPEHWDELDMALNIFGDHGIMLMPTVYFSRYYRADLSAEICEAAMRKYAGRFRDKAGLLGWYVIDEPESSQGALADYLWAQSVINAVDPDHPVTTGGNMYNYYFDRHRPVAIFDRYPLREQFRAPHSIANITRMIYRDASGPVWYIGPAFHNITGEYPRPTPAELRLMCYAALANGARGLFFYEYRQRPTWLRMAASGIVDPFEVGDELWGEIGRMGFHLSAVGPLLLDTDLVEDYPVEVEAEKIEIEWQERIPAVSVGVLKSRSSDRLLVVVYNNDVERPQEARIIAPAKGAGAGLFDLFSLEPVQYDGTFAVKLEPGEGRIYLLSSAADADSCKAQVLQSRLASAKDIAGYDAYFAGLSGLAPAGLSERIKQAQSSEDIEAAKKELAASMAADPIYVAARDRLDAVQQQLSRLNLLYEDKITSLESTTASPSRYPTRAYNSADPAVRAYLDGLQEIGGCYYALRNLFIKGGYRELTAPLAELEALTTTLAENAQASLNDISGIREPALPAAPLGQLKRTVASLERTLKLPGAALPRLP